MKNNLKKILLFLILSTPTFVYAGDYIVCGNNKKFPSTFGTMISIFYTIVRIIIPILLVLSGIISFLKSIIAGNTDESLNSGKKKLITNIITAVIIFFIASLINIVISLAAGNQNSFKSCLYCMLHPNDCPETNSEITKLCPGLLSDQDKYNEDCTLKDPDEKGNRIDYTTGNNGITDYTGPIASTGGGAIAGTLIDNPNSNGSEKFEHFDYKNGYSYYLYTPKQIDSDKAALIVYLHGTGGTGGNYARLKADGGGGFLHEVEDNNVEYNCYILVVHAPYIASKNGYSASDVMGIINDALEKNNNIDNKRISLWGYSLGAEIIPTIINNNLNFFASSVLIARGGPAEKTKTDGFKTVPTYGFYGAKDGYANKNTPNLINKMKRAGYNAFSKEYPAPQGHAYMPNVVLEDTNIGNGNTTIVDWVLKQRKTD